MWLCCNRFVYIPLIVALLAGCATTARSPAGKVELPRDYEHALTLMQEGNYQAAIPALQKFSTRQPRLAGPWVNLGIAFRETGQNDQAMTSFQQAVQLNPDNATGWHQLGIQYREQGEFEASLQAYKQALLLHDQYALAHRNIGILYDLYLQKPALALEHYRRYQQLEADPDPIVERWVVDLERRYENTQARAEP